MHFCNFPPVTSENQIQHQVLALRVAVYSDWISSHWRSQKQTHPNHKQSADEQKYWVTKAAETLKRDDLNILIFKVNQPKLFQTKRSTWYEPADYKWHEDEAHSDELYLHGIYYSIVSTCKTCVWPLMMLLTAVREHHKVKGDMSACLLPPSGPHQSLQVWVYWVWFGFEAHDHLSVSRYKRLRSVWDCLSSWEEEGQPVPLEELVGSTLDNIREADGETLLQSAEFWLQSQCQCSLRTSRMNVVKLN